MTEKQNMNLEGKDWQKDVAVELPDAGRSQEAPASAGAEDKSGEGTESRRRESAGARRSGKPAGRRSARPAVKTGERAEGRTSARTGEKAGSRTAARTGEKAENRTSAGTGEKAEGRTAARTAERAAGKAGERTGRRAPARPAEKTDGQAAVRTEEKTGSRTASHGAGRGRRPAAKAPLRSLPAESSGPKVKIIPLGGLEQIGMNITAFEYEDTIVVVDCGLAFPTDDMLGIDLVIPDVTYLERNIDKVKGFVITHGHEDHIGALPYILQKINVPVYGTKLTIGLIENKLKEHNLMKNTRRKVVKHGQTVSLGCFKVEFIKINHSIADAAALAIFTPAGVIVHTGDFKVDYTPVFGDAFDLQRFAELGKKGVLALLSDSTNAIRPGFTASERTVGRTFDAIFAEHKSNRIIVATFASNVDR
ncbi:MAG: MBL fold metallo-hydrolase, partial [Eubacteriales bacterium]|nr:MBL fold metallo-hydrolase [Eubacteriales bacterium]